MGSHTQDSFTTTYFSCHTLGKQSVFISAPNPQLTSSVVWLVCRQKKMERNKVPSKLAHNLLEQHTSGAQTASVTTQVLLVPRQPRPSLLLSANPLAWLCSLMPSRLLDPTKCIKWRLDLQIHPRYWLQRCLAKGTWVPSLYEWPWRGSWGLEES